MNASDNDQNFFQTHIDDVIKGIQLLSENQWDKACEIFESILQQEPKFWLSSFYFSWALMEMNQNLKSAKILRNLTLNYQNFYNLLFLTLNSNLKMLENNIIILLSRSICLLELKQFEEALKLCDQAFHQNRNFIKVYQQYSNIFQQANQNAKISSQEVINDVINSFGKIFIENKNSSNAYFIMGELLFSQEKFSDALEQYNKAISIESDFIHCIIKKGSVLSEIGKQQDALMCVRHAEILDCQCLEAYILGYTIYTNQENDRKALGMINEAIKINPKKAEFYDLKGNTLDNMMRYDEALESYEKALQFDSKNPLYLNQKGCLLDTQCKFIEAILCYDEALNIDPKQQSIFYNKAATLSTLKLYKDALLCRKLLKSDNQYFWQCIFDKI